MMLTKQSIRYGSSLKRYSRYLSSINTDGLNQQESIDSSLDAKNAILGASMKHVNRRGWTKDAMASGAIDAGFSPASHGMFPRGAAELAEYWMEIGNQDLEAFMSRQIEKGVQGDELVVDGIFFRLQHNIPYLRSWPQAVANGLVPTNLPHTLKALHKIAETVCNVADNASESTTWTQRKSLVGTVFAAGELYMLTDYSEGYQDTRRFIKQRLNDAILLHQRGGPTVDILDGALKGLGSLAGALGAIAKPPAGFPFPSQFPFPAPSGGFPPNPSDIVAGFSDVAQTTKKTLDDIAHSPNPIHSSLRALNDFVSQAEKVRNGEAQSMTQASKQTTDPAPKASDFDGDFEQVGLAPVKLPSGLSLFGLLSMNGSEALEIVKSSNADFKVLKTLATDEFAEPLHEEKVVRLLVDENDIVVDVLRS